VHLPGAAVPDTSCRWQLDVSFALIQQIRLVHAVAESACEIAVPAGELDKFSILRERFGLRLRAAQPGDPSLAPFVRIDHETPSTAVGGLERTLIFPRAIVEHCRTLWPATRPHRYSFAGLLTESRRALLEAWIDGRAGAPQALVAKSTLGGFVRRQLIRWRGADRQRRIGDVTVWSSERGRRFPTKAWDEDYFRMLADSASVLCPSGDYVWSYRFFEACLCGAMPIVEQASSVYEGFRYRLMADRGGDEPWSADDAAHNYRVCAERLVVPRDALDRELARLLALPRPAVSAARARSARQPS
jgi:hypothetical protein